MTAILREPVAHRGFLLSRSRRRPAAPASPSPALALALRFSTALVVVNAIAGVVSLLVPGIFRDDPAYAGNARGTYAVVLMVALPLMLVAMRLATHGSLRARVVWLACIGYLLYNAILASFSVRFNELFLVYVAALSLGVASLVTLARSIDAGQLARRLSPRVPVHAVAAYLVVVAAAFALLWLRDVVPAILAGTVPASLRGTTLITNVVEVIDLAFALPLAAVAGVWLWRGRASGVLLAGTMLVFFTLEAVSVATDQYFGHLADPSQPTDAMALFVVLAAIGALPMIAFLRGIIEPSRTTAISRA